MTEEAVRRLAKDEEFVRKVADLLYDRLKNDVVLGKLEELEKLIGKLTESVRNNTDHIVLIWEKLGETDREIAEMTKAIESNTESIRNLQEQMTGVQQTLERHSKAIESMQQTLERHSKAIESMQQTLERHSKAIESMQQTLERHSKAIESMQQTLERHSKAIESMQQTLERHSKAIESMQQTLERHDQLLLKLATEIGSFTMRAGKGLERAILNVYKEAMRIHGIDVDRVVHGKIRDTMGVVDKDKEFEVDFYETDDYVYVFEVKNYADEGVVEQMRNRVKLFSALYRKPVKFYVVANFVEGKVKEEVEREGATVIASNVVQEE